MTMLGIKQSDETKRKISEAHLGKRKPWAGKYTHKPLTAEHKNRISSGLTGREVSESTREKISKSLMGHSGIKGEKNNRWKGGITPVYTRIRTSPKYVQWRKAVFERDSYTCVECGDNKGGNLNADHIKPFAYFPELRLDVDNGRTLCISCHKKTATYGTKVEKFWPVYKWTDEDLAKLKANVIN